jgi:DNA-binding NtrC family response regulator
MKERYMKVCILIVDDEAEIRDMLSRHFRFNGYDTVTAGSVDEAVGILESRMVQVVISDIMMPGKSGIELLAVIHDNFPMIRVIMITGYVTLENALACMRKGADTCVFKPLGDLEELDEAVRRVYDWHERWQEKLHSLQMMKTGGGEKNQ